MGQHKQATGIHSDATMWQVSRTLPSSFHWWFHSHYKQGRQCTYNVKIMACLRCHCCHGYLNCYLSTVDIHVTVNNTNIEHKHSFFSTDDQLKHTVYTSLAILAA